MIDQFRSHVDGADFGRSTRFLVLQESVVGIVLKDRTAKIDEAYGNSIL
jgi:hypothetical protein